MNSRNKGILFILCGVYFCLLVSGCAHQPIPNAYDPPGFFSGILHGFLVPFSFVGSLFTDYRIYAFPNSGVWYDFGFVIGSPFSFWWLAVFSGR